jgi:hypothetical protein
MKSKWSRIALPVYTVEAHVKQLIALMSRDEPCNCCPAAPGLDMRISPQEKWDDETDHPCRICREFVGLPWHEDHGRWTGELHGCPCNALKPDEAIRRTFEALKHYQREMILDG